MPSGDEREERGAVQIVVDEAAAAVAAAGNATGGANLLNQSSALLSVSMPEIANRNRLSAEAPTSQHKEKSGMMKLGGRPPPPKMRIALPQSVDQHLLEQCQRETSMSRLSSSMGRM